MSLEKLSNLNYSSTLNEKAYFYLGELLAQRETDRLLSEIAAENTAGGNPAMNAFFARMEALQQKKIRKYFLRKRLRSFFTCTLPKAARYAAAIFGALLLAGGVALASSPTLRVNLATLLFSSTPTYTYFYMQKEPSPTFEIPADWQGSRYMSVIPEYAVLEKVFCFEDLCMAEYSHRETGQVILTFSELKAYAVTNFDTENAFVSTTYINGNTATIVEKGSNVSVIWSLGSKYYLLQCTDISKEDVVSIAAGVLDIS